MSPDCYMLEAKSQTCMPRVNNAGECQSHLTSKQSPSSAMLVVSPEQPSCPSRSSSSCPLRANGLATWQVQQGRSSHLVGRKGGIFWRSPPLCHEIFSRSLPRSIRRGGSAAKLPSLHRPSSAAAGGNATFETSFSANKVAPLDRPRQRPPASAQLPHTHPCLLSLRLPQVHRFILILFS